MSEQENKNTRRPSVFTQAAISSYERQFTAMSFTLVNGNGLIVFTPIFDEFVNKQPKKGDNVYDYDDKMNFSIDAQAAVQLRQVLTLVQDPDFECENVSLKFGSEGNARSLTIFRPNTIRLNKTQFETYVMRLTTTKDDAEEKRYHLLQRNTIHTKTSEGDEEFEIETDLLLLAEFCTQTIDCAFGTAYHGARRAGGSAPAGGHKGSRSRVVEEDGNGDGDDVANTPAKPAAGKGKPAARKNLSEEMDD